MRHALIGGLAPSGLEGSARVVPTDQAPRLG